jgi:hypothetical protein
VGALSYLRISSDVDVCKVDEVLELIELWMF